MADLGKIRPLYPTTPIRPLNKDSAKKENRKNKKDDKASAQEDSSKKGSINEFI